MTRFMSVEDLLGAKAASALSPALVNNNSEAAARARELKRQLGNLVRMLVEEDECRLGLFDHISNTLASLRALQFPHTPIPDLDPSSAAAGVKADAGVAVPEQFLCPISAELMTDPVVLSSGETYDRAYIEAWLRAGNRTCPKTQQVLQHTMLLPNHLVRHMIDHWCAAHGLPQPQLQQQQQRNNSNSNSSSAAACPEAQAMTQEERAYAALLLRRLDTGGAEGAREAARELRSLTKTRAAYRAYVGAQPSAVAALAEVAAGAGAGAGADTDAEAQEHAVTALLNVSIHGACKEWMLAQEQVLLPRLTDALRAPGGTRACRGNAAAALFSLSTATADRGDPKELIGRTPGAVLGLVDLLRGGGGERDAAQALFSLCARSENRARCVAAGGVEAVVGLLRAGVLVEESVALLALLCPPLQEAAIRACAGGALRLVLRLIADGHGHGHGRGGGDGAKAVENAVVVLHSAPAEPLREAVAGDDEALPALLQLSACGTPRARRKASAVLRRLHHTV